MIAVAWGRGCIDLNSLRYLRDGHGEVILFETIRQAETYMLDHGATDDELYDALFLHVDKEKSLLKVAANSRRAE